jgi:hypothetical protein
MFLYIGWDHQLKPNKKEEQNHQKSRFRVKTVKTQIGEQAVQDGAALSPICERSNRRTCRMPLLCGQCGGVGAANIGLLANIYRA